MKASFSISSPSTVALLLPSFFLFGLLCFVLYRTDPHPQSLMSPCRPSTPANLMTGDLQVAPTPDFRLLIGVLTHPDSYERRHLIRLAYSLQPKVPGAQIDLRFVFCRLAGEDQRVLVALEIIRFDDIIILDCEENMNDGKTYAYFSSLPRLFDDRPYDYAMKIDDDIYFLLGNLAAALRKMPAEALYYGFLTPCGMPDSWFMSGMGYLVSWDLVEWIATADIPKKRLVGPEDMLFGSWLKEAEIAKNTIDAGPRMYDYMGPGGPAICSRHELVPDTIAVHKLKDNTMWAAVLRYFNATNGLKPSKLYHIP